MAVRGIIKGRHFNWRGVSGHAMRRVGSWLYPPVCVLCGDPGAPGLDLCEGCRRDLPYSDQACPRCARALTKAEICGPCQARPAPFDSTLAALRYEPPASWLVQRFKFDGRLSYGRVLSELLAQAVRSSHEALPDALVPVPLHATRLRERGFNQSAEITRVLCKRLGSVVNNDLLRRVRATDVQSTLGNAAARRKNLRGAFEVIGQPPRRIVLVDDVMTTGATLSECARTLRRAGCQQVDVWVLARA